MNTIKQYRNYNIEKITFPDRERFWKNQVRLACYFTGTADILTEEDTCERSDRYLITENDKIVACFRVTKSMIVDIAYSRTEKGIKTELLEFMVDKWIELVRAKSGNETKEIKLLFPSYDQKQVEQLGFQLEEHQRDRLTLLLSDWHQQKESKKHSLTIRQTRKEDAEPVTRIYIDAYRGTIDEQLFSRDGLNYEDELKNISSFLNNQSRGYPIIEPASVVAISGQEMVGFCYTCNWRGLPLIWDFAVAKKHQRKGIGKTLLENVLTKLETEGFKQVALFVTQGGEGRKIYDSLGFKTDNCTLLVLKRDI
ncbi:MAG: N-acetyltransferase family protein [Candidatus Hodarchaeales archaeon]